MRPPEIVGAPRDGRRSHAPQICRPPAKARALPRRRRDISAARIAHAAADIALILLFGSTGAPDLARPCRGSMPYFADAVERIEAAVGDDRLGDQAARRPARTCAGNLIHLCPILPIQARCGLSAASGDASHGRDTPACGHSRLGVAAAAPLGRADSRIRPTVLADDTGLRSLEARRLRSVKD